MRELEEKEALSMAESIGKALKLKPLEEEGGCTGYAMGEVGKTAQ